MDSKKLLLPMLLVLLSVLVLPVCAAASTGISVGDTITELCVRLVDNSQLYYAVDDDFRILFRGDSVSFVESTGRNTIYSNEIVSYTYRKRVAVVYVDSTVCESALPLTWNGVTFPGAGTQNAILTAATGADSTVVMTVSVLPATYGTLDTAIVENALPLVLNGSTYSVADTYTQNLTNAAGCDSILTVHLTVYENVTVAVDSTVCESALPLTWNGVTFTGAGTQSVILTAATGADSTVVMTVSVLPTTYGTLDTAIVENALPLVLNGSTYNVADTYTQNLTNAAGCDSILTVHLTVYENVTVAVDSTVCESALPLTWNGVTFPGAGTQNAILTAATGADSTVVMTVSVLPTPYGTLDTAIVENALPLVLNGSTYNVADTYTQNLTNAAGCDSILTVHLTVYENVTVAVDSTVCESALPLTWNGVTFTGAGTQNAILTAATGADSTVVMTLSVLPTTYGTLDTAIVENALPLVLNGSTYSVADTYTQNLTNAAGCDSIITVHLTVYENVTVAVDSTICESALPLIWNGVTFTGAGTQNAILTADTGADSTVVMTVSVLPTTYGTLDTAIVENALPLVLNGSTYSVSDTYTQNLTNAAGCDSILTVHLTVYENVTVAVDSTVCESALPLTWNGVTFSGAGTQNAILTAATGADSTVVMTVSVLPTTYGTLDTAIVENALPLVLNGSTYNVADTYTQNLTNAAGCDSVLTVHLTVYENVTVAVDSMVCENALPLTWNGLTFPGAGTQNAILTAATGADSTVVMTLAVIPTVYESYYDTVLASQLPHVYNGETFDGPVTTTFTFTSSTGCDSVLNYHLYVIDDVSVTDFQQEHFRYSFNGQQITIVCDDADVLVSLYSVNGQLLKRERVLSGSTGTISLDGYASGFYVLQVNGKSYKIAKQ